MPILTLPSEDYGSVIKQGAFGRPFFVSSCEFIA